MGTLIRNMLKPVNKTYDYFFIVNTNNPNKKSKIFINENKGISLNYDNEEVKERIKDHMRILSSNVKVG
ncbi:hypothetical protein ACFGWO_02930 [Pasteurella multocida]|uniref:hypothetical protein n=1 Tax=Pasteurella multocida TaxID=747 RepID=UPI000DFB7A06|nr:hypothetical protein [Pasteurella multocida]MCL7786615.1 hypothetical protein [Pasteurella multocida]MCL7794606.1 hypothetical protein [Pasteurella multocida]URI02118.1 hypothetical protein M8852_07340 [Pasteurella multocida]SUB45713.1 Uncharacterised protein [Pasteurella multocida subsp. septica]HDR1007909.1 hypothetical protein [Pasteurella multocida]